MIKPWLILVSVCMSVPGALAEPSPANQVPGKLPFEIVRSMHALQDQMVLGSTAAQTALPKLAGRIADRLLAVDPEVWKDPKNARAAVTYVLGGGQARVGRKVLEIGNCPDPEKRLLEGALAYVEGREPKAKQLLIDIDARNAAPTVGGHLALVQAALVAQDDPRRALRFLDMARLLAPGTLVEEAALRREIVMAEEVGDLGKFVLLSSQYVRRFQNSVYADNFRQRFAASIVHLGLVSTVADFAKLDSLLSEFEPDEQLRLYLLVAQTTIVNGKVAVARFAAEKAISLSKDGSVEGARSKLYEGATLILTSNYEKGLAMLEGLEASQLPKRDADLRQATLAIAAQMHKWPDAVTTAAAADSRPTHVSDAQNGPTSAAASNVIDLAQKALGDTDGLLSGDGL